MKMSQMEFSPRARRQTSRERSTNSKRKAAVFVRVEDLVIPTYLPALPDKNPMFLEKRVYQGSSGKVYPLPFTDRIAERPVDRKWKAIWIENEFIRAMVLPEIGGRIHVLQDKTNGYDLLYNQPVIKPAQAIDAQHPRSQHQLARSVRPSSQTPRTRVASQAAALKLTRLGPLLAELGRSPLGGHHAA